MRVKRIKPCLTATFKNPLVEPLATNPEKKGAWAQPQADKRLKEGCFCHLVPPLHLQGLAAVRQLVSNPYKFAIIQT
jgi:hypothetical protein